MRSLNLATTMPTFRPAPSRDPTCSTTAPAAWDFMDLPFLRKLRLLGHVEGVSTLLLFGVAMPLKYVYGMPLAVSIAGSLHGLLFVGLVLANTIAVERVPIVRPLYRGTSRIVEAVVGVDLLCPPETAL